MVIDEQPFFRAGVRLSLADQPDFEILECGPDENPLSHIEVTPPNIVLLSSYLANHIGLELCARITRLYPNTRVIILSSSPNDQELFEIIRSSAVACLKKSIPPGELIDNIQRVAKGEYPINDNLTRPMIAQQVLKRFQDMEVFSNKIEAIIAPLTGRERQILSHVADGNSNRQIARILKISEQTIKNHMSAILRKLNAND